jgi:putative restriction endonuclease
MNELEEYLLTNNTVNENNYKQFNYDSYEEFKIDLDFLLNNIYSDIQIINLQTKEQRLDICRDASLSDAEHREGQDTFRKELIKKYNRCIISHSIDIECEACHIIPYAICKNFDVDNGLLLSSDLHKTFDKYCWSINPNSLKVEINKNINDCGKIKNYEDTTVNIKLNNRLYNNLLYHYNVMHRINC